MLRCKQLSILAFICQCRTATMLFAFKHAQAGVCVRLLCAWHRLHTADDVTETCVLILCANMTLSVDKHCNNVPLYNTCIAVALDRGILRLRPVSFSSYLLHVSCFLLFLSRVDSEQCLPQHVLQPRRFQAEVVRQLSSLSMHLRFSYSEQFSLNNNRVLSI
jgi:hypothetical protein